MIKCCNSILKHHLGLWHKGTRALQPLSKYTITWMHIVVRYNTQAFRKRSKVEQSLFLFFLAAHTH